MKLKFHYFIYFLSFLTTNQYLIVDEINSLDVSNSKEVCKKFSKKFMIIILREKDIILKIMKYKMFHLNILMIYLELLIFIVHLENIINI